VVVVNPVAVKASTSICGLRNINFFNSAVDETRGALGAGAGFGALAFFILAGFGKGVVSTAVTSA
jgi:hypothetical protein